MTRVERDRPGNWLSWDYIPKPENSDFSMTAPFQLEMLVNISENMRDDPDRKFFRAESKLSNVFYSDITSKGVKFSGVSKPVKDYIKEYPEVVDYILYLIKIRAINMKGKIPKGREVPTFNSFIRKKRWK